MTRDDLAGDEESVGDDGLPAELRAAINGCLASSISGEVVVKPTVFVSKNAKQAVMDAFELVGGVPRLAHYADKNYGRFVNGLFSKALPLTVAGDPDAPVRFEVPWLSKERFANMATREPVTVSGESARVIPMRPEPDAE